MFVLKIQYKLEKFNSNANALNQNITLQNCRYPASQMQLASIKLVFVKTLIKS